MSENNEGGNGINENNIKNGKKSLKQKPLKLEKMLITITGVNN